MSGILKVSSLREQVYDHLRQQMNAGSLCPGATINIGEIAKQLGISKTPLRDALIHLELEGFVTILPRRGVLVNQLDLPQVKNAYDAIGIVEASIVVDCFDRITAAHIREMEALNQTMINDIENNDFQRLFNANLEFHDIYLDISDNEPLRNFIRPIKHRLYDFPRHNYIREWELRNCQEHAEFIQFIKDGNALGASRILKNAHWSFDFQKDFIQQFYNM